LAAVGVTCEYRTRACIAQGCKRCQIWRVGDAQHNVGFIVANALRGQTRNIVVFVMRVG
jgi:hypothetical protein